MHKGKHHKIPQIGIVRIEDDVEIGSGTTIDRAALGETVIGEGTKIDNLVQIGHNVKIGKHCLLVSQVGIAGSTELGDHVFVAGQSGFSGHLKIGHRVQVAEWDRARRYATPAALLLIDTVPSFSTMRHLQGLLVAQHPLLTLGWKLIVRVDRQHQMDG